MSDWITFVAGIVGAGIAGVIGVFAVTYSQDREQTKRQRSAALAIREDIRRIRRQLLVPGVDHVQVDAQGVPISPGIHPWIIGMIPELASALPEAFARLMQLQSDLERRGLLVERYAKAIDSFTWARGELERNRLLGEEATVHGDVRVQTSAGAIPERDIYQAEVRRFEVVVFDSEKTMEREQTVFATLEDHVRQEIGVLDRMLTKVIDRPVPPRVPQLADNPQSLNSDSANSQQ